VGVVNKHQSLYNCGAGEHNTIVGLKKHPPKISSASPNAYPTRRAQTQSPDHVPGLFAVIVIGFWLWVVGENSSV
jgi:hypothetical protein